MIYLYQRVLYLSLIHIWLITRGAAIESIAPQTKELSEAEFYSLMESILNLQMCIRDSHSNIASDEINTVIEYEEMTNSFAFGSMEAVSYTHLFGRLVQRQSKSSGL